MPVYRGGEDAQPGWDDRPLPIATASCGNLLRTVDEFVGRITELKRLAGDLPSRQLFTFTGPGGVGNEARVDR